GDLPLLSRIGSIGLLNNLNLYWDSVLYQWQVLILDYENDLAKAWFEVAFGRFSPLKLAIAVLSLMGLVGLVMALAMGMVVVPRRKREPFRSLARIERWYGVRAESETLRAYFQRLVAQHPSHTALMLLAGLVECALYQPAEPLPERDFQLVLDQLRQQRRQQDH
ncbi:hypothetical protein, partial [Reinekea sp.]|uniref:hypothetical protein n=1 Tax=Reinekea sp. TaxID=1970455 RepID=UPI002A8261FE